MIGYILYFIDKKKWWKYVGKYVGIYSTTTDSEKTGKRNNNKYHYDGESKADTTECGNLDDNKYSFGGIEKIGFNEMIWGWE